MIVNMNRSAFEQAMKEKLVQLVIAEYENGNKTRTVFA